MRRLPAVLALGLTITAAPVPALACAVYSPLRPEAVRGADVVVVGRLSDYRREVSAESRRRFEAWSREPRPAWMPAGPDPTPVRDLNTFTVDVERVVAGQAPARIRVDWPASNISPPETIEDGQYLIALTHTYPGAAPGVDFVAVGHACSGAFLYPAASRYALEALSVLAGKPSYPPDPPRPPEPEPSPSDIPMPAPPLPPLPPGPWTDEDTPLLDRIPPGQRVMLGGAGVGLFAGMSAALWRRRKDEEAEAEAE